MPNPRPLGNVAKGVLLDVLDSLDSDGDKLGRALADILDGDDDTTEAELLLVDLLTNNGRTAGTLNHIVRDDLLRAEQAAQRLAASCRSKP